MMWMSQLLYPDVAQYDLYTEAAEFFKLFYHADLTQAQYDALVAKLHRRAAGAQARGVSEQKMERLFHQIRDALMRNEDLVLCTIIASSGSTPRGSGAKMAVFADGSTLGTVGGGAVEYESIQLAKRALQDKTTFTHGFNLSPNQTADIGMICGGQVVVYIQFFKGGDEKAIRLFSAITELFQQRKNTWLVTQISEGCARQMGVYSREEGLRFMDEDTHERDILPLVRPRAMLRMGDPGYYVEPLTTAGFVYVFGGGHVAQELVPVLARIDLRR